MSSLQKINKLEAISLIVMVTINVIIFNLPNHIITDTGSSTWLNIIFISVIAILFCLLICKLFRPFPSQDLIDVSEFLGNKFLKAFTGILYLLFFLFVAGIFLAYFIDCLRLIYFDRTPIVFLLLLFLIPVVYSAKAGIKPIASINLVITPIILLSMLIIFFVTSKGFVPERIFPIFGFGINQTFFKGLTNIFTFSCFAYLYFLIPILESPEEFKKISIISTIISSIYLFLSVICLIMMFPFISFSDGMLSVYLLTRMIEFGRFLQRVDAIFIFIWILSTLSFLSITICLINRISKKLVDLKNHREMTYSVCFIVFSIALVFRNITDLKIVQNIILKYIIIALVFIISLIILVLANIKQKKEKTS